MQQDLAARAAPVDIAKISFAGVNKFYSAPRARMALADFGLNIVPQEIVSIVGPTACGKSTSLNLLAGFEQPSSGLVSVDGEPVTDPGPNRGVVFQQPSLFPWLTVMANVVLGVKCRGAAPDEYEPRALRLLEEVGLKGFERHDPTSFRAACSSRYRSRGCSSMKEYAASTR